MRARSLFFVWLGGALVAQTMIGCTEAPGRRRPGNPAGTDAGNAPTGETGDQCADGIDNDSDGVRDCDEASCRSHPACGRDSGPPGDSGFTTCDERTFDAETSLAPVDIVWVIDNSGSMDQEARLVQQNINRFVEAIAASGIDYHVVVVTDPRPFNLMIPPPLGTDTERFRLVRNDVFSDEAMSALLDGPQGSFAEWSDFLRPDALLHFVHLTDDESNITADDFITRMQALLGGRTFTSHVIASPPGSMHVQTFPCPLPPFCLPDIVRNACNGASGAAAANGDRYWDLAQRTGGERISICSPDWSTVFDTLIASIGVPTPIPCEFAIPEPPAGMEFDRRRVNVVHRMGSGGEPTRYPFVGTDTGASCPPGGDGWYYDHPTNPTQIILCPVTCDRVEADTTGSVNIALGCETIIL